MEIQHATPAQYMKSRAAIVKISPSHRRVMQERRTDELSYLACGVVIVPKLPHTTDEPSPDIARNVYVESWWTKVNPSLSVTTPSQLKTPVAEGP